MNLFTHPFLIPTGDVGANFVVREYWDLAVEREMGSPQCCPATWPIFVEMWESKNISNEGSPTR